MAAFTPKDPADQQAFRAKWRRILADASVVNQTIVVDGDVAGYIAKFERAGAPEVTYWIGKEFWGRGIATAALRQLLARIDVRPLFARVAHDNDASLKVLLNCGFVVVGEDSGYAHARGAEIDEYVLELAADS